MDLLKEQCILTLRQGIGNSATVQFSKSGTMTKRSRRARPIGTHGTILAPPIVRHLVRESPPRRVSTTRVLSFAIVRLTQPRILFHLLLAWSPARELWPPGFTICSLDSLLLVYELIGSWIETIAGQDLSLSLFFSRSTGRQRRGYATRSTFGEQPDEKRRIDEEARVGDRRRTIPSFVSPLFLHFSRFLLDLMYIWSSSLVESGVSFIRAFVHSVGRKSIVISYNFSI